MYHVILNTMVYIFSHVVNILFPKSPASILIAHENPVSFLRFYTPHRFNSTVVLCKYNDPLVQAAITANKFHHDTHAALLLASLLHHWLSALPSAQYTVIPIPLSTRRQRERGHNQVITVAQEALRATNIHLNKKIILRKKNTKAQSHLSRKERLMNIDDAFTAQYYSNLENNCLLLLDDVTTTGSTLLSAFKALRTIYPHNMIICIAIAH